MEKEARKKLVAKDEEVKIVGQKNQAISSRKKEGATKGAQSLIPSSTS